MSLKSIPDVSTVFGGGGEIESAFASGATLTCSRMSPGSFYIQFLSKGFLTVRTLPSKALLRDKTLHKSSFRETIPAEKFRAYGEICVMAEPSELWYARGRALGTMFRGHVGRQIEYGKISGFQPCHLNFMSPLFL